ncbi:four-carbon acid sugar kinase family protein [Haladaptatus sp. DYSN1]|uniref:four-carbon acid sugar kinase family protein n=1 Tax=unclassified Haladaptatus TaxID=2622732 RepID=UPI0024058E04|nr:four-carbon acid sugar kinase family protein [Haladaptatus sp. DYSN1]
MEYAFLVVADDLTGAMDTGNEFARRGYATTVALGARLDDDAASVAVVNTESRYSSPVAAAEAIERAVRETPAGVVYKKVDSTLRGNLVAEIDAALKATGADLAVVAPAFPANGRTTEDGIHRVNGTPVTETAAGNDPDKPVETAHLPTLLSASDHLVSHLPAATAEAGPEAVATSLAEIADSEGPAVVSCDARSAAHLAAIAEGSADSGLDIVYVGSAGLAEHVGVPTEPTEGEHADGPPRIEDREARVLGIAGSTSPVTVEQVAAVPEALRVQLDLRETVVNPETATADAATRTRTCLRKQNIALLETVGEDADEALRVGRERDIPEREIRSRISETLGAVTARLVTEETVTGLFLTGGAVAADVLGALGTEGIRLQGVAVESGVPIGRLVGGEAAGLPVVTKAGAFGETGTIHNCLATLGGVDE